MNALSQAIRYAFGSYFSEEIDPRVWLLDSVLWVWVIVALSTEILSRLQWLVPSAIQGVWACVAIGCVALGLHQNGWYRIRSMVSRSASGLKEVGSFPLIWKAALAVLLTLAFTGVICPPSNWDSMTYHLPRIFHWLANQSVEFYPTPNVRQNQMPPLGEYGMLHLWSLTGKECVFCLLQFGGLLVSIVAASRISQLCGGTKESQLLSGWLMFCSWPVLLQSTTPKNDILVGMFLLVAVEALLRVLFERERRGATVSLALAVALGLLTKGTSYTFMIPVLIVGGVSLLFQRRLASLALVFMLTGACCVAINGSFWLRNWRNDGHPLGSTTDYTNAQFDLSTTFMNAARAFGSCLTTNTAAIDDEIYRVVEKVARVVGFKSHVGTTFQDVPFALCGRVLNEDFAPFHVHIAIACIAIVSACIGGLVRPTISRANWIVLAIVAVDGILFFAISRWQIWITRLLIPLAMLASPWIGTAIMEPIRRPFVRARTLELVVAVLFFYCLPAMITNELKRFIGHPNNVFESPRSQLLFSSNPALREELQSVCDVLREISQNQGHRVKLGLLVHGDNYEYPFWIDGNAEVSHLANSQIAAIEGLDAIYASGKQSLEGLNTAGWRRQPFDFSMHGTLWVKH